MFAAATIPVTIQPAAAAHIQALGLQAEFEQMVEQALQVTPHLSRLQVFLQIDPEGQEEPGIILEAEMPWHGNVDNPIQAAWSRWKLITFPPEVFRHFTLITSYGDAYEG